MSWRKDEKRTSTTMNALNGLRITHLAGRGTLGGAYLAGGVGEAEPSAAGSRIGVDEMVWDSHSGTIATFQDSPSLISLLNSSREGFACSFVA